MVRFEEERAPDSGSMVYPGRSPDFSHRWPDRFPIGCCRVCNCAAGSQPRAIGNSRMSAPVQASGTMSCSCRESAQRAAITWSQGILTVNYIFAANQL